MGLDKWVAMRYYEGAPRDRGKEVGKMRKRNKPIFSITRYLEPQDTRALALFFSKYPHVEVELEKNRIVFRSIGVRHFHELSITPAGMEEVEA